jgi:hypothetical protein
MPGSIIAPKSGEESLAGGSGDSEGWRSYRPAPTRPEWPNLAGLVNPSRNPKPPLKPICHGEHPLE